MEFVFAVHPSNTGKPADDGGSHEKQGAAITHEAVAVATKLLSSVPASMNAQRWFEGISGQFFTLFDGEAGPDVAKTAAQIVGFGILGKKQFGAPGNEAKVCLQKLCFLYMYIYILMKVDRSTWLERFCAASTRDHQPIAEIAKTEFFS
jgi:hypothetical protein